MKMDMDPMYFNANKSGIALGLLAKATELKNLLGSALEDDTHLDKESIINSMEAFKDVTIADEYINYFRIFADKVKMAKSAKGLSLIICAFFALCRFVNDKLNTVNPSLEFKTTITNLITLILESIDEIIMENFLEDYDEELIKSYSLLEPAVYLKRRLQDIDTSGIVIISPWDKKVLKEDAEQEMHASIFKPTEIDRIEESDIVDDKSKQIISSIINAPNTDILIVRINNLPEALCVEKLADGEIDIDHYDDLSKVLFHIFDAIVDNASALDRFDGVLDTMIKALDDDPKDHARAKSLFEEYKTKVDQRLSGENDLEKDPIVEMGIDYILDAIPEDVLVENITPEMLQKAEAGFTPQVEAAMFNVMNEFVSREKRREIKDQKAQAKFDRKQEKKQYKQNLKDQKRDQRRMEREGDKMYRKAAFREREIVDPKVRKSMSVIKAGLKGLAVGGVASFFAGPYGAVMGALTALRSIGKDNPKGFVFPSNVKKKLVIELDAEIKSMESQLDELERRGDRKNYDKMMRLKDNMEMTSKKLKYTMYQGDVQL